MANCPVEVTPFNTPGIIKTPKIFNLNYTNQDFWSMKARLIDFIKERFGEDGTVTPNTFNDLVEGDIAIMIIESFAFLADTLSFKMDQIVNELFIDTVTEVENAFRLSRLVGFEPLPPIAARSFWTASINQVLTEDIRLTTPIRVNVVSDTTPIIIELFQADSDNNPLFDEDIIIPAGKTTVQNVIGLEGRTVTEETAGTGEVSQTIQLGSSPVIFDSISVEVDGALWEKVDYFTDSQPRREYRTEFNSDYQAFIIFGNNRAGLIPTSGSQIRITYRVGGGTVGNIVTGFVETQRQSFVSGLQFNVPVNFRNHTRGEFGYNGDTISDIRRKLPAYLRTQDRAVTGLDYQTVAEQFATPYHGQIGKATAALRNHGCAGNIVDLYILAKDDDDNLTTATNELKVDLSEEINLKKMITDFVCIRDGEIIDVDVSIDVTMDRSNKKFEPEFQVEIERRVTSFFNLNNWEFGDDLREIDLVKELTDIKQIETMDITFTTNDEDNSGSLVTTKFFEIVRPDDITINFIFS